MPTRARFSPASQRGAHSNSATWPVNNQLTSSGMDRSPERSPAFYRGHGNPCLPHTKVPARVDLMLPTPVTRSGFSSATTSSSAIMPPPVCSAWVPASSPGSGRAPAMPSPGKIPATWQSRTASRCDSIPDQKMPSNTSVPACREQPA